MGHLINRWISISTCPLIKFILIKSLSLLLQEEEMERVKNLVLVGKIPLDQAPPEMAHHPVMLIENHCNQLIAERRAKVTDFREIFR